MFRPQADVASLVLALMIIAQRIKAGLARQLIKPALREDAAGGLDAHHRGAAALVRDRRRYIEPGILQMVVIALAGDTVLVHAVMRQTTNCITVSETPQFVDVEGEDLTRALQIVQEPDFASDKLYRPNSHRIGRCAGTTQIPIEPYRQERVSFDFTDPFLCASFCQAFREICAF